MTDISELHEGDEIEAVVRLTVVRGKDQLVVTDADGLVLNGLQYLVEIAERITVVRPEIIPGKAYVDAEGKFYAGLSGDRLLHVDLDGTEREHHARGLPSFRPLPAGLRPAKVVAE